MAEALNKISIGDEPFVCSVVVLCIASVKNAGSR